MSSSLLTKVSINGDRLLNTIAKLGTIGQLANGAVNSGVQRLAFSPADVKARDLVQQWMAEVGMQVRVDAGGNIIGRYSSKNPDGKNLDLPAIATGSHIDTVPNGGLYDGAYGVLAAIEVVRSLQENSVQLNHPLEVIVFTDEEGSMIGCKAMAGSLIPDPQNYGGLDIQSCLSRIGGNWEQIMQAQRDPSELAAFVELHIEQGPVLECAEVQIGVVEGIVGQRRFKIIVKGSASHAGTTPMSMRQDALVAAAQVVLSINKLANLSGQQVATVGRMIVKPNAPNTIPDFVEMSLDIRDLSDQHLDHLLEILTADLKAIATATKTEISMQPFMQNQPAICNSVIQSAIAKTCEDLGLTYLHLPSRAGHDAQEMAKLTAMGMIFVPSQNGISHSETEFTSPELCIHGANVLLHTILKLDELI